MEKVKQLEEDIGEWHDKVVLAEELEKFVSHGKDRKLSAFITRFKIGEYAPKNSDR